MGNSGQKAVVQGINSIRKSRYRGSKLIWLAGISATAICATSPAFAQNIIANPGFENSPPPRFGNNIGHSVAPWILTGGSTNVVKVDRGATFNYGIGGPNLDASGSPVGTKQHYLDIASSTAEFYQAFTVPNCSNGASASSAQYTLRGAFSVRETRGGVGSLQLRQGTGLTGATVAGTLLSINLPADPTVNKTWSTVTATVTLTPGQTYSYVVAMDDYLNFDEAFLEAVPGTLNCPAVTLTKSTASVPQKAGDTLDYVFKAVNTSSPTSINVNNFILSDPKCATAFTLQSATSVLDNNLTANEVQIYTCTSIPVTQAEIDARKVDNTVTGTGTPASGTFGPTTAALSTPVKVRISADDENPPELNGVIGNSNLGSVLDGDLIDGNAAATADVEISIVNPASNAGVKLDPATGILSVAPGTPAGTYTIDYKICDLKDRTNCATATAKVVVTASPIAAEPDTVAGINGVAGNPSALNVLAGDTINSAPATLANATLSVAPGSTVPEQLTFDPATGVVGVKPGTPAGTYTFDYQICETLNPANCKTATASVTVDPAPIVATNDTASGINGAAGATAVANAFTSDKIGDAAASPTNATVTLKTGTTVPAGLTFNTATGSVDVQPGTPAGSYVINYTICEKLNPTNCKDATITVDVVAAPIVATDDTKTGVNGITGDPAALNLFTGDKLNGADATPANTTLIVASGSTVPDEMTFNPATGVVGVKPGTPAGTYSFDYKICETLNPTNCKTATASVIVDAAPIVATNDTASGINGAAGATAVANAFTSDTIGGIAASSTNATVTLKTGTTVPQGLTFNTATGSVDVAPGTPAGSYVINYTICEKLNPTNCKDATITVDVVAAPVAAAPDTVAGINGVAGNPSALNVLAGDTIGGAPATLANATLSVALGSTVPAQLTFNPATGVVGVKPGTPAGSYSFDYQICETLNPTNCKTATASVTVDPAPIVATNDTASGINGAAGATAVANAFTSDTIGGVAASSTNAVVTLKTGTTVPAGLTFNAATGSVDVQPGTPAGSYVINYTICEKLNPTNCKDAKITVDVVTAPISASPDEPAAVIGAVGGNDIINAFTNDKLNGVPVDPAKITATVTSPAMPGALVPILDPVTGFVDVPAGTPASTYTINYTICEKLNPANCADSFVTVVVNPAPIVATNDTATGINGTAGAIAVANAFTSDTVNNVAASPSNATVKVKAGTTVPEGLVFNPATGNVDVKPGTPAGSYVINYTICEILNPANCKDATITVDVVGAPIAATPDTPPAVNGGAGNPSVINAFTNDKLNGVAVTPDTIKATIKTPASNPGVALDPATGNVSVAPGTPAGSYEITYEICEKLNPANCATTSVKVVVDAAPIAATPDTPPAVNGGAGNPSVINAFANDKLNGVAVTPDTIKATIKTPASNPGVVLDPVTGNVSVAPGTPAGSYEITYEICEKLNPSNCATTSVKVVVDPAPIVATDDSAVKINGATGATAVANAFTSDTIGGVAASPSNAVLTLKEGTTVPAGLAFDPATGNVDIKPGTPAGSYVINYTLCEKLNPANCIDAKITVEVVAPGISAAPDAPAAVNGANGGNDIINVFTNDKLNGVAVDPAKITATITTPATPGALTPILDPVTGFVDVPAGTPAGTYVIDYTICEKLNPANCASSKVIVIVEPPVIAAATDVPAPVRQGVGNPNAINAFANDTLNGKPVDPGAITAKVLKPASNPGVVFDPATGNVSISKDVPAGTYTIEYEICERANPANCAKSVVTVEVGTPISGVSGTVYTDLDGDRIPDADEPRRAGWIVEILRDGKVVATTNSDEKGNYNVAGLDSGPGYSIRFRNPENNVVYDTIDNLTLAGNTTVVDQNKPIDPSGVIFNSVTRAPVANTVVRLLGANGAPLPGTCFIDASQASQRTGASGEYRFDIVPGAAPECPVGEAVYTISVAPPSGFAGPSSVLPPLTGPLDPTGQGAPVRISPEIGAPQAATVPYYYSFRLAAGDPDIVNNHIPLDPFISRLPLIVTKTSPKRSANIGDVVPYEITVRNSENVVRTGVEVVDILPPGMKYVLGTASVNGIAQEPVRTDRKLSWEGQVIPANGSVRYNLTLVVGAGVTGGEKVNTGLAQNDADDVPISNRGTAVVTITPSAVFDCSELLGKVFEDRNYNGYQDEGEPGVPGVRLATVNGQLITADAFGRYHIACAAVPDARIGSNFVLKIDTRTLPLGWKVTTDNPRSIRLTRGKFGELNFGVAPPNQSDQGTAPNDEKKGE